MTYRTIERIAAVLAIAALPNVAYAHTFSGGGGFVAGLMHPVLGFDHFLAMLSVGIISAQMGGRAIWTVPSTFVAVMLIGGVLGISGVAIPAVELGIGFSVMALGVAIATGRHMSTAAGMIFVAVFAVFHGHAHGTEMPNISSPALYALGFVTGTAGIHIAGVIIGVMAEQFPRGAELLRFVGAGIAGIGFHILMNL